MSTYTDKLDELCNWALSNPGTAGARAIRKVITDLEGDGPVGEIMHSVDSELFTKIIGLLVEFRRTGCREPFNSIHHKARKRLQVADGE